MSHPNTIKRGPRTEYDIRMQNLYCGGCCSGESLPPNSKKNFILGHFSYEITPSGCKYSTKPTGQNRYSNMADCKKAYNNKHPQLLGGKTSYVCNPEIGCHQVQKAPGHDKFGTNYSNMHACQQACKSKKHNTPVKQCSSNGHDCGSGERCSISTGQSRGHCVRNSCSKDGDCAHGLKCSRSTLSGRGHCVTNTPVIPPHQTKKKKKTINPVLIPIN